MLIWGQVKGPGLGGVGRVWAAPHHWGSLEAEAVLFTRRVCALLAPAVPSGRSSYSTDTDVGWWPGVVPSGTTCVLPSVGVGDLPIFLLGLLFLGMVQGAQAVPVPKDCWLQVLGSLGRCSVMVQQSQEQQVWFSGDAKLLQCMLHCSVLFNSVTPWTIIHQPPPSMGFPRQEHWIRLPFPSLGGSSQLRDRTCIS